MSSIFLVLIFHLLYICQPLIEASYGDYDDSNERYFDYYDSNYNPNLRDVYYDYGNNMYDDPLNINGYSNDHDDHHNINGYNNIYDDHFNINGHNNDYDDYHNINGYDIDYNDHFTINGYGNNYNDPLNINDFNYNYNDNFHTNGYSDNYDNHHNRKNFIDNADNYNYYNYPFNYDFSAFTNGYDNGYDYPDYSRENDILGLTLKSEEELWKVIYDLEADIQAKNRPKNPEEMFPILQRRKRGIRRSSSSRSSSSSSSSSSSRSSSRSSSGSSWGGSFGSRKSSSSSSSRDSDKQPKYKQEENKKEQSKPSAPPLESAPVDKSSYPKGNYPQLHSSPAGTGGSYPSGSGSAGGYPRQPSSGYPYQASPGYANPSGFPQQPSSGYPQQPSPGYPHQPSSGYPSQPSPGYPHQPSPGYPHQPSPGYPLQPSQGYTHLSQPSPGYPHQPTAGYPHQLSQGYPHSPSSGYPHQPSSGYPHLQSPGYPHQPSLGYPGKSYGPTLGTPFGGSYPKASKKEKVMKKVQQALELYAMKKMYKNKNAKFISPSGMGMHGFYGGGMHGSHGGGIHGFGGSMGAMGAMGSMGAMGAMGSMGAMGAMGSMGAMKTGKKILGTIIKLQIAKYALKFGASAAKAYFEYKLGRNLEEHVIEKFIERYHRQKTRNYYRQNGIYHKGKKDFKLENITLGEDCVRDCNKGESFTCFFSFHIHLYQYLSRACYKCPNAKEDCDRPDCIVGSGRHKLSIVTNKQLPGPTIQVCEGDKVLLEVYNELPSSGVTIHFRGQTYSETPYMEGTIGLTQNIISPGELFAYSFKADVPGTHFWHANTGVMRSDGIYGPFIVKEKTDSLHSLYDIDLANQTIMVSEDFVKSGEEQLVDLNHKKGKLEIYSLLINGRGFKQDGDAPQDYQNKVYAHMKLQSGKRNRVRLISAVSSNCPVSFRVLGQQFSVIAMDGHPVTPKKTAAFLMSPSERVDIVLEAIPIGLHWIEIRGYLECANHTQYAVLESRDLANWDKAVSVDWNEIFSNNSKVQKIVELPSENPVAAAGKQNELSEKTVYCNNTAAICARNLTSISSLTTKLKVANLTLYLSLTARPIHNEHYYSLIHYNIESMPVEERGFTSQINNLTLKLAHEPLLFNARPLKSEVCSSAGVLRQHCVESFCECLHLQEIPLNAITDVVLINEGKENSLHPQTMYLHGHNFWLISQNNTFIYSNESLDNSTSPYLDLLRVIVKDVEELLFKNNENPIRMNSVTVPAGGYAVIRFNATNPGFWLLESSSVFKSTTGMAMIFKVGEKKDLPNIPKKYSKC